MVGWIVNFNFLSLAGVLWYWVPLAICLLGYALRTWRNYRIDVDNRQSCPSRFRVYTPTDTVGNLLGRVIKSVVPILNILAVITDVGPELGRRYFKWLHRVLTQPVVPDNRKSPTRQEIYSARSALASDQQNREARHG